MEKLRAFLEVLKKYHFWVLCGLVVLISFGSWFLATMDLAKRYTTQKGQIEGRFTAVKKISGSGDHPSAQNTRVVQDRTAGGEACAAQESLTSNVNRAWKRLYDEQRLSNPLPPVFTDENAQRGFREAFERIWGPMEEIEKMPVGALDLFYRENYLNHIKEHFPTLFKMIERRTVVEDKESHEGMEPGGRGGPQLGFGRGVAAEKPKETVGIVDWVDADKLSERFARWNTTPTTLQLMLAQEDLWVYEALLKVIRNTNNVGPDKDHYQKPKDHKVARIKQIVALNIGDDAVQAWAANDKSVIAIAPEAAAGGGPASGGRMDAPPMPTGPMPMGRDAPSYIEGRPAATGGSLLAGRYVDDNGKPLADPTQQPNREFRMMPINLKVVIEQKDIPRLLTECANSSMRIDVRTVRLLLQTPPALEAGAAEQPAAATSAPGGEPAGRPVAPTMGEGRAGMMMGGSPSTGESGEFVYNEESADPIYPPVLLEVQGIIYIYNPPTVEVTGEETGGQPPGAPPAGGSHAAGPAAAPAQPGPPPANPVPANPVPVTPAAAGSAKAPAPTAAPATTPALGGRP